MLRLDKISATIVLVVILLLFTIIVNINALTQHRLLRCNSLNIFRLPCWSPSWEGWTRPWKVFQIKVSQLPCNNLRIAKNGKPNFAGDENGKREEDLEEEIKDVKERFRNAEVMICSHLGTIWLSFNIKNIRSMQRWLSGQYRNFRQKLTRWR